MREAAEAKAKRYAKATDREKAWAEAQAKDKAEIARISAEDGGKSKSEAADRARAWS